MRGKLYSVGIGPGDPELMTLKAVRLLKECDVVALPKGDTDVMTAKEIVNHVVDLDAKPQLIVYMPMTKDMAAMDKAHREGADAIEKLLDEGKNVVFITLGCPTVYATCIYVHKLVLKDGYDAELVAGVTSICAVAAKLNTKNSGMVERCGLPGEKIYRNLEEVDPKSSYFSVILVKEKEFDE